MSRLIDLTGQRFGRLTVLRRDNDTSPVYWRCQCDCGNVVVAQGGHLKTGNVSSCKCLARENTSRRATKHGKSDTPEYRCWQHFKDRCLNPNNKDYHRYGANGVTVHPEWVESFAAFLAHIGPQPEGFNSVDRIDNSKGYEPGNVQWANPTIQARNREHTNITPEEASLIKALFRDGKRTHELGRMFKVSQNTICGVVKNKTWKDIEPAW